MSPIAALTGSSAGTAARMPAITDGDGAPSEPSAGFLTSTMSAPAAAAARASPTSTTLTSSLMSAPRGRRGCRSSRAPRSPRRRRLRPSDLRARAPTPRSRRCRRPPGPHELWPAPAAPSRSRASTSAAARGWKRPPCTVANASPTSCWMRVSAPPNSSTSRSTSAGQQRGEHELRDLRRALGRRHELPERLLLGSPRQPGLGPRDDQHDAPLLGHRVARQQRRRALVAASHAALDDETPERERPRAHRGARRATDRLGQLRRADRAIVERRQRLRDRERELRARPQPDVRRDRLDHAQVRAAREPERLVAAARERQRALGFGALGGQLVGRPRLDHDRGPDHRHAEPAEAPRPVAGHREHPEVQPRRAPRRALRSQLSHRRAQVARDVRHRLALPRPGGLVDERLQAAQLGADVVGRRAGALATRGSRPRAPRGAPG